MTTCPICTRPENDPYVNEAADERCVDACHDQYLTRVVRLNCEQTRRVIYQLARKTTGIVGGFRYQ